MIFLMVDFALHKPRIRGKVTFSHFKIEIIIIVIKSQPTAKVQQPVQD